MDLVANVIEGQKAIEKHEDAVRKVKVVLGATANSFQLANDVIREEPNGA